MKSIFINRREPVEPEDATKGRDVFNEIPPPEELIPVSDIGKAVTTSLPDNVVQFLLAFEGFWIIIIYQFYIWRT